MTWMVGVAEVKGEGLMLVGPLEIPTGHEEYAARAFHEQQGCDIAFALKRELSQVGLAAWIAAGQTVSAHPATDTVYDLRQLHT